MKKKAREIFSEKFQEEAIFVETTDEDLNPWDRRRIVAVLVNETGIDFTQADKISDDIQSAIFSSGLKVVTSELVRELVNAKLIEYKLEKAREKNRRLGLSLYDVGSLLKYPSALKPGEPATPESMGKVISDNVKRQYALTEVFPSDIKKLHVDGRFHIHGLSDPDRPFRVYINAQELIDFSIAIGSLIIRKPRNYKQFINNLTRIDSLLSGCIAERIVWFNIEKVLFSYSLPLQIIVNKMKKVVSFMSSSRLSGKDVSVIISEKSVAEGLNTHMMENMIFNVEILAEEHAYILSPLISFSDYKPVHTGFTTELITINLPGTALRAMENGTSVERELDHMLLKCFEAFSKKLLYMEKLTAVKPGGILELLSRLGYHPSVSQFGIAVCGLNEWIRIQHHGDMDKDERFGHAFEFLSTIKKRINALTEQKKINVILTESNQDEAAYRFARLDLRLNPYFVSRIINGAIENSAVYYSSDASLPADLPVPINIKARYEGQLQSLYDIPFRAVMKCMNMSDLLMRPLTDNLRHLVLTLDFSICHQCLNIIEGVYQTCPECSGTEIFHYAFNNGSYVPEISLNRASVHKTKNYFYYRNQEN